MHISDLWSDIVRTKLQRREVDAKLKIQSQLAGMALKNLNLKAGKSIMRLQAQHN